jgi:peptide/nickel transport system substrate-binding protein
MLTRRTLLQATTLGMTSAVLPRLTTQAQDGAQLEELTIDLSAEPASLAPALVYEANGWSVVHSIFDAPFEYDPSGALVMVAAESLIQSSPLSFDIKLRPGVTFHDGTPLTAASLIASHAQIADPDTGSQIAGNFGTIINVQAVDELTARIMVSDQSPWLPAQIANWMLCVPAGVSASDLSEHPVGTGPYSFVEWKRGESITVEANPAYDNPVKGKPIARRVVFRFVAEASTRVADLHATGDRFRGECCRIPALGSRIRPDRHGHTALQRRARPPGSQLCS